MKNNSYNTFFTHFSNRTKLSIVFALKEKSLSVNEIAKEISEEQSNVSHHLKNLTACHILNYEQRGKKRIYSLNKKTILPLLDIVKKHNGANCRTDCTQCQEVCR